MARPRGSLNKTTIEKREVAAQIAARTMADARYQGRKLAKEHLSDFLELFRGMMATYQPNNPREQDENKRNPTPDEEKFRYYANMAMTAALGLAPYESPKFAAYKISVDRTADENEPVRYRTAAEIAQEIHSLGLPPLREIIEAEIIKEDEDEPEPAA